MKRTLTYATVLIIGMITWPALAQDQDGSGSKVCYVENACKKGDVTIVRETLMYQSCDFSKEIVSLGDGTYACIARGSFRTKRQ